jgi:signal transduction histidine kinase
MPPDSPSKPHFRVSPEVLGPLGAEQLQDPALAILELIKNAWDADATRVAVSVEQKQLPGRIAVVDNGHGMRQSEFEDRWLVIGASHKRGEQKSEGQRPLIGEKGLGRLASFALGSSITIKSARKDGKGFIAEVNWESLRRAASLEDYEVNVSPKRHRRGTRIEIHDLKSKWETAHTDFLVTHAEFLASVPGERFRLSLRVDGRPHPVQDPLAMISRLSEATLEMNVGNDGTPRIVKCKVNGVDETHVVFREMKDTQKDPRLSGVRLFLKFFRRGEAAKRLSDVLERNEITDVLERYQGVRVYRDGINVPPYGLHRDDWAALEKQRTSTGGPTLVPGNSQLIGEVHISRMTHPHLVITAGRSGFSDQTAVGSLANYVRWAVRELGTARRAEQLGITTGMPVPTRVDVAKSPKQDPETIARAALAQIVRTRAVRQDPALRESVEQASTALSTVLDRNEETLRLYAQLASTGIAATSFAHELRAEFDVVSEAVAELKRSRGKPDKELLELLNDSWGRIRAFGSLFKVIPVKLRRQRKMLSVGDLKGSVKTVLGLAPPDKVTSEIIVPAISLAVVPAEFDSILLNLVSNSVKAIAESRNRESGKIRVALTSKGADVDIRVADNGCGISPKVAAIMFEPLEGRFAEGTGMGLPIVKFIAERYKGRVQAERTPPPGYMTEMVVSLRNVVQ